MKRIFFFLFLFLILNHVSLFAELIDRIVAKVDNMVILQSEIDEELQLFLIQSGAKQLPDEKKIAELRNEILKQLIENKVLLIQAKKDSIEVEKKEIDDELDNSIKALQARFPSLEAFQKELEREKTTIEELKAKYREDIRDKLLVQKLLDRNIRPKVSITTKDVEEFYKNYKDSLPSEPEKVRLSHILITVKPSHENIARQARLVSSILKKLKSGQKFETLAQKYSDDTESAKSGGDLGFIKRGQTVPQFEEIAFALKSGETSSIVESPYGFHIIRCIENLKDSVHVKHILIGVIPSQQDEDKAKNIITALLTRIKNGEDFKKIASNYSDDIERKESGGDLGLLSIDQLPPAFKDAVALLKVQEVSEPIRTDYGYHVLKLTERIPGKEYTYEEVKDRLTDMVRQRKMRVKLDEWLIDLKKKVYIEEKLEG